MKCVEHLVLVHLNLFSLLQHLREILGKSHSGERDKGELSNKPHTFPHKNQAGLGFGPAGLAACNSLSVFWTPTHRLTPLSQQNSNQALPPAQDVPALARAWFGTFYRNSGVVFGNHRLLSDCVGLNEKYQWSTAFEILLKYLEIIGIKIHFVHCNKPLKTSGPQWNRRTVIVIWDLMEPQQRQRQYSPLIMHML